MEAHAPLLQSFVDANGCVMSFHADGLGSSVRNAVAARPLLAASSQVPPVVSSFVALAISITEIPVVGSSASILKAFLVSLVLKI
jgi:hypothetical protein